MSQLKNLSVGFLFILLQITMLNMLAIKGIRPDLLVLFIVGRALSEGPTAGVLWGFGCGLILDSMSGGLFGLGAFTYAITGFISGQFSSKKGTSRSRYLLTLALGSLTAFVIFLYFIEPWDQAGWGYLFLTRTLPGAFYSWFFGFIWIFSPFAHLRAGKGRG
ncbi:rod shape-determining protein MreD [candidate division LCP-89 bacterium B3_LCP]|uniref:Rod shape-determining protein MreD n=1 Tax=candidate division LCP-89 bacterium B3_LCP TaxID=2012998 RepID=A0A532V257_UNCL8|nr:MAG: rod shape-determining protein MreD [candidate division LCP-89 bacterium B3_LCP]